MLKKYKSFPCLQALKTLQVNVNDPRIIECKVSYLYDLLVQPVLLQFILELNYLI